MKIGTAITRMKTYNFTVWQACIKNRTTKRLLEKHLIVDIKEAPDRLSLEPYENCYQH